MSVSVLGKRPLEEELGRSVRQFATPKEQTPCIFFSRGECSKTDCEFLHSTDQLASCYACGQPGHYARKCPNAVAAAVPRTPCKFFALGLCTKGAACDWLHPAPFPAIPAARTPCKFYLQGACKLGAACTWLHPGEAYPAADGYGYPSSRGYSAPHPYPPPAPAYPMDGYPRRPSLPVDAAAGHPPRAPKSETPCAFFQRGACNNPVCPYLHGERPVYPPPYAGPGLGFASAPPPPIPRRPPPPPYPARPGVVPTAPPVPRTPCKFWQQGLCTRGEECTWLHV